MTIRFWAFDRIVMHCGKPVPVGVAVQRRPLTCSEARTVIRRISYSRSITGYSLREWTGGRDTFVLLRPDSSQLLGALLVHHLRGGWSEIAVVFILEEHRGKGMVDACFKIRSAR